MNEVEKKYFEEGMNKIMEALEAEQQVAELYQKSSSKIVSVSVTLNITVFSTGEMAIASHLSKVSK